MISGEAAAQAIAGVQADDRLRVETTTGNPPTFLRRRTRYASFERVQNPTPRLSLLISCAASCNMRHLS